MLASYIYSNTDELHMHVSIVYTPYEQLFECSSLLCVCVLLWGANGFLLPSNAVVEGACSAYETVCVCVVLCGGVYEIIIIISQLHWVSL